MAKTLIIPGLNGSGYGHWQRYWLADDPNSILVEQPDWARPDLEEWRANVESALQRHPGAILIAHSFGALVVASLAGRASAADVGGALLVAPCDPDRARRMHPGVIGEAEIASSRTSFASTLVGSRNDPYMSLAKAADFAAGLGADFVDLGHAGHVNVASGFGRWARGYRLAQALGACFDFGCDTAPSGHAVSDRHAETRKNT
jgi:predicted alpha/beta hydrolase family esterase